MLGVRVLADVGQQLAHGAVDHLVHLVAESRMALRDCHFAADAGFRAEVLAELEEAR